MLTDLFKRLRKVEREKREDDINSIYLLVHPFYALRDKKQIIHFGDLWKKSIDDASQNKNAFAIVYFEGIPSKKDVPEKLEFANNTPSQLELGIGRHIQSSFGINRSKVIMASSPYKHIDFAYDPKIKSRMANPKEITVSARGVYADAGRCVEHGLQAVLDAYNLYLGNSMVIYEESVFYNRNLARRQGVPDNVRI